jgi:hypothetical protein
MATTDRAALPKGRLKNWLVAIGGTVLAVAAGVLLPQTMANGPLANDAARSKEPAQAKSGLSYQQPEWPKAPDAGAMVWRLVLGTVSVLGLCGVTLWIGKRWLGGLPARKTTGNQLHVLEMLPLNRRCGLYLVKAGTSQVLVGIDQSGLKGMVALAEPFDSTLNELQSADELPSAGSHEPAPGTRWLAPGEKSHG